MINIIFDLDDTLIKTNKHYFATCDYFVDLFKKYKIEKKYILDLIEKVDLDLIKEHKLGFHWYKKGLEIVYEILKKEYNVEIEDFYKKIENKVNLEFKTKRELRNNVIEILEYYKQKKYKLYIMTLGDEKIQHLKINNSNIKHYFDDIFVVKKKDDEDFNFVKNKLKLDIDKTYFVGNSIESDMIPAKKIGLNCILLNKHTTLYNKKLEIPEGVNVVSDLIELKNIIK